MTNNNKEVNPGWPVGCVFNSFAILSVASILNMLEHWKQIQAFKKLCQAGKFKK